MRCTIIDVLAESYRDNTNRSAALANDNIVSLLDKFQITAKALSELNRQIKILNRKEWSFECCIAETEIFIEIFIKGNPGNKVALAHFVKQQLAFSYTQQFTIDYTAPLYTPERACVRDTSLSMFNVNTSPTSEQVSANIYIENFKIDFETAS